MNELEAQEGAATGGVAPEPSRSASGHQSPLWTASGLGEEGGEEGGAIIWVAGHNGVPHPQGLQPGAASSGQSRGAEDGDAGAGAGFDEQLALAMERLGATLHEAGASWGDVVSVRAYVAQPDDIVRFEERYSEFFQPPLPARTLLCGCLRPGVLFEIECVAVRPRPNLHVGG